MTEKKLWTLTVDEEFKALIPPLSVEERQMLVESLIANGCEMPILVWDGCIVDGHNRYAICHEHGIKSVYRKKATFLMNDSTIKAIRKLKSIEGQYLWQPGLKEGQPDMLLNYRIHAAHIP